MDNLIKMIFPPEALTFSTLVFSVMFVYIAVKAFYDAYKWIKARFDGYHEIKNDEENKEEKMEGRIETLEQHDSWQYRKLNELGDELKEAVSMLHIIKQIQSQSIIALNKEAIFNTYEKTTAQGYITQIELNRFLVLVDQYKAAGGDGIVDEKIYPEVLQLPIRTTD